MRIAVVGCGPAGASCAYHATKDGHEVVVFEKESAFAAKPCGNLLTDLGYNLIRGKFILEWFSESEVYWYFDHLRTIRHKPFCTINKAALISQLVSGILVMKRKIESLEELLGEYDLVVIADGGVNSLAQRYLGYKPEYVPVLQAYAKTSKLSHKKLHIFLMSSGYAWAFPYSDCFNIGVGTLKENNGKLLEELIKKFDFSVEGKIRGWPVVISGPSPVLRKGKVVGAGEAVGFVMPTTGEGISYALISGKYCYRDDYELLVKPHLERLRAGRTLLEGILKLSDEEKRRIAAEEDPLFLTKFVTGEV
jgi:flavin-dependent dehydrogenase